MALRDYLNVESRQDLRQFVLQNGQAVAVVIMNEQNPVPLETWYFKADSLSVDNNTSVIRPNAIAATEPGRYILNTTEADWNLLKNKPTLAPVALSGNYNDLNNKLTAGNGVILQNNELKVDDSKFLSVTQSNQTISQVQSDINNKTPLTRTITVNGITQDLTTNRSWEVGNLSSTGSYTNPTWITSLSSSKITGLSNVATTGSYVDLSSKPIIPTSTSQLTNDSGFLTSTSAQSWESITGKPNFSTVATSGSYVDLTGKPIIPTTTSQLTNDSGFLSTVPAQSFASLTAKPTTLSGYGITDAYPLNNPSGYISSVPAQTFTSITGKPTTLSGYGITDAYPLSSNPSGYLTGITQAQVNTALGITPINTAGARSAISVTNTGMSGNATYNSTTGVINIPNYSARVYTGSATVSSSGNTVYYLTNDGTSTGTALFTDITFAVPFVNDSTKNYTYGWSYDVTTKALTVNTKVSNAVVVAGVSVLGIPTNVANGTVVTVLVRGN